MNIWAIADLHLPFGAPDKSMEVFGERWKDYTARLERGWQQVKAEDLVLIAGDISWAKSLEQAEADLEWIDKRPGTKVMIRGNHDYWWGSLAKLRQALPPSIHVIQNDTYDLQEISIGGSRLWDSSEYGFEELFQEKAAPSLNDDELREQEKVFKRELERLELSLKRLNQQAALRIAMTHYPPIGLDLKASRVSTLFEKYRVTHAVFGHLHNVEPRTHCFGLREGINYFLTSADYLEFKPLKIYSWAK